MHTRRSIKQTLFSLTITHWIMDEMEYYPYGYADFFEYLHSQLVTQWIPHTHSGSSCNYKFVSPRFDSKFCSFSSKTLRYPCSLLVTLKYSQRFGIFSLFAVIWVKSRKKYYSTSAPLGNDIGINHFYKLGTFSCAREFFIFLNFFPKQATHSTQKTNRKC